MSVLACAPPVEADLDVDPLPASAPKSWRFFGVWWPLSMYSFAITIATKTNSYSNRRYSFAFQMDLFRCQIEEALHRVCRVLSQICSWSQIPKNSCRGATLPWVQSRACKTDIWYVAFEDNVWKGEISYWQYMPKCFSGKATASWQASRNVAQRVCAFSISRDFWDQMYQVLSSLFWSQSWPYFQQEVQLWTSWGPFQPELSCTYWYESITVMCERWVRTRSKESPLVQNKKSKGVDETFLFLRTILLRTAGKYQWLRLWGV